MHTILQPPGWAKPRGYSNGVAARGRLVFVGGQIGWNGACEFETDELAGQVEQTLRNILEVVAEAGGEARHIVSLTWYLVDRDDYVAKLKEIGEAYRRTIGRHYPAMAVVQVDALVEKRAKVEIQAMAVIPD